jgi:tRNA-binding protein
MRLGGLYATTRAMKETALSATPAPFEPVGSATIEDFDRLDIRIGRIVAAATLEGALRPAYRLRIDFGAAGERQSSARITDHYPDPESLLGRLVVAVVNLPPRRVAGYRSEVLVLGSMDGETVLLLGAEDVAVPGQRIA